MVSITMHNLIVEKRTINNRSLSWSLAQDLRLRVSQGKIAIVTDNPAGLLASTRKQWIKLIQQIQRKRSATLGASRIARLVAQIVWMQNTTFTAKMPSDLLEADVTFATAEDFVRVPPACSNIFITYSFEREKLHMLTAWMPRNAVVLIYEQD
jgi:hypothetical protein